MKLAAFILDILSCVSCAVSAIAFLAILPLGPVYAGLDPEIDPAIFITVYNIICIVFALFSLVPLCWSIPMTVVTYRGFQKKTKLSIAFKVCTLIFVNIISGILLLCDQEDWQDNNDNKPLVSPEDPFNN